MGFTATPGETDHDGNGGGALDRHRSADGDNLTDRPDVTIAGPRALLSQRRIRCPSAVQQSQATCDQNERPRPWKQKHHPRAMRGKLKHCNLANLASISITDQRKTNTISYHD